MSLEKQRIKIEIEDNGKQYFIDTHVDIDAFSVDVECRFSDGNHMYIEGVMEGDVYTWMNKDGHAYSGLAPIIGKQIEEQLQLIRK